MESFSSRLKKLRLRKHLSQKEVAFEIGVPPSTYRDWEYGKKIVGEPYVELAEAFGVSLSELLTGKEVDKSELLRSVDELDRMIKIIQKIAHSL